MFRCATCWVVVRLLCGRFVGLSASVDVRCGNCSFYRQAVRPVAWCAVGSVIVAASVVADDDNHNNKNNNNNLLVRLLFSPASSADTPACSPA